MSTLIAETLELYAEHCGDPYDAAFAKLYAARADYEGLFFLDTDEGLRRNMMQTTSEIITTHCDNPRSAENLVIGTRLVHLTYEISDDFDLFFTITRDVMADGLGDAFTPSHAAAWDTMLQDFEKARV